jgi:microcystin-dependent protein
MAGVSGAHLIGTVAGSETHTLLAAELPPHFHTYTNTAGGGATFASGAGNQTQTSNTGNGPGTSTPFSIIQPTVYMNIFIKL